MKPKLGQVVTVQVESGGTKYTVTLVWMQHLTDGKECWFVTRSNPWPSSDTEEAVMNACLDKLDPIEDPICFGDPLFQEIQIHEGDDSWHGGAGWYYTLNDYPDEGSFGPFKTVSELMEHAEDHTQKEQGEGQ